MYERIRLSIPKSSWLRRYVTKNVCKLHTKRVRLNKAAQHDKQVFVELFCEDISKDN